jgi:hypothetical protein
MNERDKREPQVVAKPPPEVAARVDGGGPWGPSDFDLPDPEGNRTAIIWVAAVGGLVLVLLIGFLALYYFQTT